DDRATGVTPCEEVPARATTAVPTTAPDTSSVTDAAITRRPNRRTRNPAITSSLQPARSRRDQRNRHAHPPLGTAHHERLVSGPGPHQGRTEPETGEDSRRPPRFGPTPRTDHRQEHVRATWLTKALPIGCTRWSRFPLQHV